MLFQKIRAAALRTWLRHRLVCRRKVAVRIVRASIESVAATARFLFHQLAIRALRALYTDEILLDVLAIRIAAAGYEFAVASMAQHHIAIALGAKFFQRNIRHALALIKPPRGLAIRISGASHELAKASTLQDHYASAVLAV